MQCDRFVVKRMVSNTNAGEITMVSVVDHKTNQSLLYDRDFHQWTQVMAEALRSRDWSGLDVENLVEEVESLGDRKSTRLNSSHSSPSRMPSSA